MEELENSISVDGIVARRDGLPYLRIHAGGKQVAQVSMAQARKIAADILQMCARTEADAMIYRFFATNQFPVGAAAALMMDFREFRLQLDSEPVEGTHSTPSGDPPEGAVQ